MLLAIGVKGQLFHVDLVSAHQAQNRSRDLKTHLTKVKPPRFCIG